jgi:predicted RNA-binding Zn-ribbon protein involved in translation (DUF1610 family)
MFVDKKQDRREEELNEEWDEDMSEEQVQGVFQFAGAAMNAVRVADEAEFTCPICGGVANAKKGGAGRVVANCTACGHKFQ